MEQYRQILSKKQTVSPPFLNTNQNQLSVFISYSVEDKDKIDIVVKNLKTIQGLDIFYADSSIQPGDIINQKIIQAIQNSDIFLVFYSMSSIKSVYVQQEIGAALATGKIPIPILLDETKPAGMIANNIHYLDFSDENKKYQEYNKLHQFLFNQIQSKIAERNSNILGLLIAAGIGYLAFKSGDPEDYEEYY